MGPYYRDLVLARVSSAALDSLASFETEREDMEDDLCDEPGEDGEPDFDNEPDHDNEYDDRYGTPPRQPSGGKRQIEPTLLHCPPGRQAFSGECTDS
jgi:hypothetical protein